MEGIPRLWTAIAALTSVWCGVGAAVARHRERSVRRRLRGLVGDHPIPRQRDPVSAPLSGPLTPRPRQEARKRLRKAPARWPWNHRSRPCRAAFAGGVGILGAVLVDGPLRWPSAAATAYAVWWWLRRRRTGGRAGCSSSGEPGGTDHRLPLAAELMAACLTAGSGPAQAAEAVGRSLDGALGEGLSRAACELRLGGTPESVWGRFGELPGCATLARCLERAGTAGVPAVDGVSRLAAECRARRARAATARARRVAVLVTGPLGLCFLPAFLAVGVAPVVLGLTRALW